ncbi:MAG: hypothetical protein AAF570_07290, partial [Bacteroidota bacterium]
LNILFVATLTILIVSVVFTLITGESPLEALGISPLAATIGTAVLVLVLALFPFFMKKIRGNANQA